MSCCGKKREELRAQAAASMSQRSPGATRGIVFEYVGSTAMAVIGAASGRRYSFPARGARVEVDARDGRSLAAVPDLRRTV